MSSPSVYLISYIEGGFGVYAGEGRGEDVSPALRRIRRARERRLAKWVMIQISLYAGQRRGKDVSPALLRIRHARERHLARWVTGLPIIDLSYA